MKVYNPQWNQDMEVDQQLAKLMTGKGYETWHTGGGCFAWRKELPGGYLMMTVDSSLGSWSERDERVWMVGRYLEESFDETDYTGESWICHGDLTLTEALTVAEMLPVPAKGDERYESGMPSK